jgi:hypothetical protein
MVDTSPAEPHPLTPGKALAKLFLDNANNGPPCGEQRPRGRASETTAGDPGANQPQQAMMIRQPGGGLPETTQRFLAGLPRRGDPVGAAPRGTARTLQAHVLSGEAVAAARTPGGRYVATYGAEIMPIDGLTEPPQGHCRTCLPIPAPRAAGVPSHGDHPGDYLAPPLRGLSPADRHAHAVDPETDHPASMYAARCGHRLLRQQITLRDAPQGHRCRCCARRSGTPINAKLTQRQVSK